MQSVSKIFHKKRARQLSLDKIAKREEIGGGTMKKLHIAAGILAGTLLLTALAGLYTSRRGYAIRFQNISQKKSPTIVGLFLIKSGSFTAEKEVAVKVCRRINGHC